MPIKLQLTADEYDEELHSEDYVAAEDGNYVLAAHEESVQGLKSALKKERQNVKSVTRQLKAAREGNNSAEQLEELQSTVEGLSAQLNEAKAESSNTRTITERVAKQNAVLHAAATEGLPPDTLSSKLQDKLVTIVEDGKLRVFVQEGEEHVTVKDYMDTLHDAQHDPEHELYDEQLASNWRTRMKSGGGTPPGGSGSDGTKRGSGGTMDLSNMRRSKMTREQKVAVVKAHGEEALLKLPY